MIFDCLNRAMCDIFLMDTDIHPLGTVHKMLIANSDDAPSKRNGFSFNTIHKNYGTRAKREGPTSTPVYDLTLGEHYFFVVGRSGGYRLDKIHFFKEGAVGFKDDSIQQTSNRRSR